MIYLFSTQTVPELSEVGGKGLSLIKMARAGLPVPSGFVCALDFFQPWLDTVRASSAWQDRLTALENDADLSKSTAELQKLCDTLSLTEKQQHELDEALSTMPDTAIFAVRSSSPEEDLEGASFAGVYETCLGVKASTMLDALQKAFASAFDVRVFVYKVQHGFDPTQPKIAVVVQTQIASESAGVGFSVNPLNNDYDESFINANWGLGESVVSGMVTTDQFVVNKVTASISERQLGGKERAVFLDKNGGTHEQTGRNTDRYCISDEQVLAINAMLSKIENLYQVPIDIEWAVSGGKLYLLQARPITTYVPLTKAMQTAPGDKRMLYFDVGLVDTMTINQPILPLTIDWMSGSLGMWLKPFVGSIPYDVNSDPHNSVFFASGGRTYLNISQLLTRVNICKLSNPNSKGGVSQMDNVTANLLANIDVDRYKADKPVNSLKWTSLIGRLPTVISALVPFSLRMAYASMFPEKAHHRYQHVIKETLNQLHSDQYDNLGVRELMNQLDKDLTPVIGKFAAPPMSIYMNYMMKYMGNVDKLLQSGSAEDKQLAESLTMGFSDNKAASIGIHLFKISKMLTAGELSDLDAIAKRIENREMPAEFLSAWDQFTYEFGFRGPSELELSNPRYGDTPRLALEQMSYMQGSTSDPEEKQRQHVEARERAFAILQEKLSPKEAKKLRKIYKILDLFGPARDTPKYLWTFDNGLVRKRALAEGEKFVEQGRLERADDIFWLTLDEIDAANANADLDLHALIAKKKPFYDKLKQVSAFPHMIDSRGRIAQVKKPEADADTFVGISVSRGKAKGRVKVLTSPQEKPIAKGDVLVAYTTDPGWTPLFVNVSAIILEIGGVLQHGGVVAREYGKPCIAGIQGITKDLQDGQWVEVDGTTGTVRLLDGQDKSEK